MTKTFTNGRFLLLAMLAAVLATSVFTLGLGGGFVLDDVQTIVTNPLVHVETLDRESLLNAAASFQAGEGSRPLAMVSFALDYWRHGGIDAPTYKITNLVIHALTTLLLAFFLRHLLLLAKWPPQRAAWCAVAVAVLWAVHPLQVSSVLYVVQRMQTLATLFLVLALWGYLALRQAEMEGRPAWRYGLATFFCWLFALASKEDAILLPLYALALELTVLRFRVAQPARERGLRWAWFGVVAVGTVLFLFWIVPHFGSSEAYAGRAFSSAERVWTQCRVLVMYLGQILLPLPSQMPFNYDTVEVSRGLLTPITTLLSLLVLLALLAWAWLWRARRPVFAFGVMLFFAGHFMTSNVIALELVFEHRNHFPLIGVLLALADLFVLACQRLSLQARCTMVGAAVMVLAVATAGATRAYYWGDPVRFAQHNVDANPDSPRAWLTLGGNYFDLAGRKNGRGSPFLDKAIATVEEAAARTGSISAYSNIVIYKTIQGTVAQADWDRLLQRLEEVPMLPANKNTLWTTLANVRAEIGLDENQVLRLIEVITRRATFQAEDHLRIGVQIYKNMRNQAAAMPYLLRAARDLPPGDPRIVALRDDLLSQGRQEWAEAVEQASTAATDSSVM